MRFGTDFAAIPDFDGQTLKREYDNLAEALARRLITPRGALWYAPQYGTDLRVYLGEVLDDAVTYEIERLATLEVEKDERVESAEVRVTQAGRDGLRLSILARTRLGPFRFVLHVTQVSAEVLYAAAG